MPALLPVLLTASHVVLAADTIPKFNVELTCLEMAKQAHELPEESKVGTSGSKVGTTGAKMGTSGRQ